MAMATAQGTLLAVRSRPSRPARQSTVCSTPPPQGADAAHVCVSNCMTTLSSVVDDGIQQGQCRHWFDHSACGWRGLQPGGGSDNAEPAAGVVEEKRTPALQIALAGAAAAVLLSCAPAQAGLQVEQPKRKKARVSTSMLKTFVGVSVQVTAARHVPRLCLHTGLVGLVAIFNAQCRGQVCSWSICAVFTGNAW
jgi:hypothetical protein